MKLKVNVISLFTDFEMQSLKPSQLYLKIRKYFEHKTSHIHSKIAQYFYGFEPTRIHDSKTSHIPRYEYKTQFMAD